MLTCESIDQALAAHGRWYIRLRCAIETGRTVFTSETSSEACCELGLLLREDPGRYQTLRRIHADFHREVGRIFALAIHGHYREARVEFEANTHFTDLSTALRKEMHFLARQMRWQPAMNLAEQDKGLSQPETTYQRN